MPYTKTTISNMALSHCLIGLRIASYDNENSAEAENCRLWFDHVTQSLIELMPWPFVERRVSLTELDMDDYPEYEDHWDFIYAYPNFAARINKIVNLTYRTEPNEEQKIPFKIIDLTSGGKAILCDEEDAIAEYNHLENLDDIVSLFSATFAMGHSLFLATYISGPLKAASDVRADIKREWSIWLNEQVNQANSESQPDPSPQSHFQTVRG